MESIENKEMRIRSTYFRKSWRKTKSGMLNVFSNKLRGCLLKLKKCIRTDSQGDCERRKSSAKLQPPPDRPIRRAASKLKRRATDDLVRLRLKGDDWTANDLFRFQYSDPESGGTPEQRKQLCYEWLDRLHDISKKYCYLAWYEAAIYACYYRLAPILTDVEEKKAIWHDVKMEYAEIFLMGRRIWRRPIHPSRLRVFYDMAMLCVRFGEVERDTTIMMFRDLLHDSTNFDFKVQNEVEFAKSIDKISRLENFVIDQFYSRRRSSGSVRTSFRSRRVLDRSPSRRSTADEPPANQPSTSAERPHSMVLVEESMEALTIVCEETADQSPASRPVPCIVVHGPRPTSPKPAVRFENNLTDTG